MPVVALLCSLLWTLTACEKQQAAAEVPLSSKLETNEWRAPACKDDKDCTAVVIRREVFTNHPALNDAIRTQLLEQLQGNGEAAESPANTSFAQLAQNFIAEAAKVSDMSVAHWQMNGEAEKLARHGNLLTVAINTYTYSGGAHGMPVTHWLNWDLAQDKRVILNDIIEPGQEGAFWNLARDEHEQWLQAQKADADFRSSWPFQHSEDFQLTEKGVVLLYGVYTLAPYSSGEVELTVPHAKLEGVVRKAYLVAKIGSGE
ncbi:DUF3298 domain-containing protein [Microbulbifer sp. SAOS-129_SWC]|uniref:DUF3298 and DUF4163 domain-containing protein n=1 Tax=Microbulbifer sp. SAOS-129_SWC TaxID=3145235 RepID=UPI003216ADDE